MDIEYLYQQHAFSMYNFAMSIVQSKFDAEDIVADIFVSILLHPEKIADKTDQKGYLFWMTKMRSLNKINRREPEDSIDGMQLEDKETELHEMHSALVLAAVENSIAHLPRKSRDIFKLSYIYGYTNAAISGITGIAIQSVKNSNSRSLARIRSEVVTTNPHI